MDRLPDELLVSILRSLGPKERLANERVSVQFRRVLGAEVWKDVRKLVVTRTGIMLLCCDPLLRRRAVADITRFSTFASADKVLRVMRVALEKCAAVTLKLLFWNFTFSDAALLKEITQSFDDHCAPNVESVGVDQCDFVIASDSNRKTMFSFFYRLFEVTTLRAVAIGHNSELVQGHTVQCQSAGLFLHLSSPRTFAPLTQLILESSAVSGRNFYVLAELLSPSLRKLCITRDVDPLSRSSSLHTHSHLGRYLADALALLTGLTDLSLPGSRVSKSSIVTSPLLRRIADSLPQLQRLNLRAVYKLHTADIQYLIQRCSRLQLLNLNRSNLDLTAVVAEKPYRDYPLVIYCTDFANCYYYPEEELSYAAGDVSNSIRIVSDPADQVEMFFEQLDAEDTGQWLEVFSPENDSLNASNITDEIFSSSDSDSDIDV